MSINISYETNKELNVSNYEEVIESVVEKTLDYEACPYNVEVNVTLSDNEEIARINASFREIEKETDVLSFPGIEFVEAGDFNSIASELETNYISYFNPENDEFMLGDMIISVEKIKEQAIEYGHSETRELAFLVVHSMLHLLGYDHMNEEEASIMEKKQEEILHSLSITRDYV